jgi:hypothetical protein
MFEKLRESLRDAMNRASSPSEGRAVLAMMRDAIVEAKVGVSQIRSALDATRAQLEHERRELDTVRRRGRLAADIGDQETVRVAAQFEQRHLARVEVLERKLAAQESELALAEREVDEMTAQLRAMASGAGPAASTTPPELDAEPDLEALERAAARAARESAAERQLDELKRRMGR